MFYHYDLKAAHSVNDRVAGDVAVAVAVAGVDLFEDCGSPQCLCRSRSELLLPFFAIK